MTKVGLGQFCFYLVCHLWMESSYKIDQNYNLKPSPPFI
jgi:hypothetical protein